jgi:ATP phosphoribosyltransferase
VRPTDALANDAIVIALPAGRILTEALPILARAGIVPEPAFTDPSARQLRFKTGEAGVEIVRARSFDVATLVAYGAASLGVAGSDVIGEFDYAELYAPVDLGIGRCRLIVAAPAALADRGAAPASHLRIATKYPNLTGRHFAQRGVQAECIKLNGSIELAPSLGLCEHIVDLTQSGKTLAANGLVEVEEIMRCSARLVVNRTALKTRAEALGRLIGRVERAVADARHAA